MNVLILGGTRFIGRHLVHAAQQRGHTVTLFHRGKTNADLFPDVEKLHGDRSVDLSTLQGRAWDAVIDTNVKGPFLCARLFGPRMAARGWGRIVNLGSILSVIGIAGRAPYAASKAAVANLTRVLALEWAGQGVTVNAICPGPFGTDMNRPLLNDPEKYAAFVAKIPVGRWGELHEIAGATVFLASDASSFVTGSLLFVDGGWTAQ